MKLIKIEDFSKLSLAKRTAAFENAIGKTKTERQNTVFNAGSNMLVNVKMIFIGFEGKGKENDTIRGNTVDSRYIELQFKNGEDSNDKTIYRWAFSNAIATGKKLSDGDLLPVDLRSGTTDDGRKWVMIAGDAINEVLPQGLDDCVQYLASKKEIVIAAKEPIYAIPFGTESKETAIEGQTKRNIYAMAV